MSPMRSTSLLKLHRSVSSRSLYGRRHSSWEIARGITRLVTLFALVLLMTSQSVAQNPQGNFSLEFRRTPNGTPEFFPPADSAITCRDKSGSLADIDLFSQDTTPKVLELDEGITLPPLTLDYDPTLVPYRCQVVFQQSQGGEIFVSAPVFVTDQDFQNNFNQNFLPEVFVYYPVDTPVSLQVRDLSGHLITDTFGIKLTLFDPNGDETTTPAFQKQGPIPENGQINLVNDFSYRYRLRSPPGAINPGNGTGNSELPPTNVFTSQETERSFYIRPDFETLALNQGQGSGPTTIQLIADEATAKIDITLFDSDGSTPIGGYVRIESDATPAILDSFDLLLNGEFSSTSTLPFPVVAGRTYKVSVFPPQTQQGASDKIPPKPKVITIPAGSTSTFPLNFTLKEPNYLLTLNLSATNQSGGSLDPSSFSTISCSAYNARKEKSSAKATQGESSLVLPLYVKNVNKKENWKINCFGVQSTGSNSRKYSGSLNYQTIASQTGDSTGITIGDSGTYYALISPTVLLDQSAKLTFPDGGATIEFPSGALSNQSGSGTVEISSATEFGNELETVPLTVWEITPKVGGSAVTTPEKDAELCIPVDESGLTDVGATTAAVVIARYEEESQTWIPLATTITADENGDPIACASIDHFSILGTIIDVALALQKTTPSSLKLRMRDSNLTTKRCVATWTAPETEFADVLTYTVRYKKFKATNKRKQCQNLTEEQLKTTTVAGKTRALLKTKGSCCVEVLVEDGEASTLRKYKKPR